MSWLRRNPVFATTLLVLGLGALGEAGLIGERCVAARAARMRLDQASRELRALETIRPAPTRENAARIEAGLARVTLERGALLAELAPPGEEAEWFRDARVPARRPEAFFDIAVFVEAMRGRARQAGVSLRPEERFGFSNYSHEAPETAQLAAVFRERLIVQYLLEALLDAQPHQLLSVQRSRPEGKAGVGVTGKRDGSTTKEMPGAAGSDYFEIDPRISARVPGLVEATAFRLSFTGHTTALRTLLTKLGEFELPVVVRAVEVAPAERPPDGAAPLRTAASPLVAAPWSRFTVTVEFIDVAPKPAAAS